MTVNQKLIKKIILVGYMGCGKSLVAKELSKLINTPFIDLDSYIELQEKQPIHNIFNTKGEIYFRKQESLYLKHLLEKEQNYIISTGGGTPCFANNMKLIQQSGISIYLKISPKILIQRLSTQKHNRPLISHIKNEDLSEFIHKHLFERIPFYSMASHTICTDSKNSIQIATEIKQILNA